MADDVWAQLANGNWTRIYHSNGTEFKSSREVLDYLEHVEWFDTDFGHVKASAIVRVESLNPEDLVRLISPAGY